MPRSFVFSLPELHCRATGCLLLPDYRLPMILPLLLRRLLGAPSCVCPGTYPPLFSRILVFKLLACRRPVCTRHVSCVSSLLNLLCLCRLSHRTGVFLISTQQRPMTPQNSAAHPMSVFVFTLFFISPHNKHDIIYLV